MCVSIGYFNTFMPYTICDIYSTKSHFNQHRYVGMPLRYNNDKRKKP